ncbi:hypothetical protein ZIOFF_032217 [Zingiber officinale]|uniref:Uncharacterized protein n=1 Tax=Zingiber officinale TaxID=94328 RepID=A0A8J5L672_ZINOF|nr:hypothetical protein ZIOFF_032217 [Zingiber officinale]
MTRSKTRSINDPSEGARCGVSQTRRLRLLYYRHAVAYAFCGSASTPRHLIGIIKRKALIKELAAAYHAECLAYCQKLQQLQRKWEEVFIFT